MVTFGLAVFRWEGNLHRVAITATLSQRSQQNLALQTFSASQRWQSCPFLAGARRFVDIATVPDTGNGTPPSSIWAPTKHSISIICRWFCAIVMASS